MKYMLLIYAEETVLEPGEREACYQESTELAQDLHAGGHFLGASPLHPTSTATSVRSGPLENLALNRSTVCGVREISGTRTMPPRPCSRAWAKA